MEDEQGDGQTSRILESWPIKFSVAHERGLDELFANKVAGRKFRSTKTQTELEGMQAKEIQTEKTRGGETVEE